MPTYWAAAITAVAKKWLAELVADRQPDDCALVIMSTLRNRNVRASKVKVTDYGRHVFRHLGQGPASRPASFGRGSIIAATTCLMGPTTSAAKS